MKRIQFLILTIGSILLSGCTGQLATDAIAPATKAAVETAHVINTPVMKPTEAIPPTNTLLPLPAEPNCGKYSVIPGSDWAFYPADFTPVAYLRVTAFQDTVFGPVVVELGQLLSEENFKVVNGERVFHYPDPHSVQIVPYTYYFLDQASPDLQTKFKKGVLIAGIQLVDLDNSLFSYAADAETLAWIDYIVKDALPDPEIDLSLPCHTEVDGRVVYYPSIRK